MENLPAYISLVFILSTIFCLFLFYKAALRSRMVLLILLAWLILQAIIASGGFYTITDGVPPRLILLVLPPLLTILLLFTLTKGRQFMDGLNIGNLTLLHIVRIPVELVLYWLAVYATVPWLMTFEGRNFDIIAGLTAPLVYYFGFIKHQLSRWPMILWNVICLLLLLNIVVNAALSAPTVIQQFAFEQPNIAVLYFPYVFLPGFIVPVVLFSHLVTLRQLLRSENNSKHIKQKALV